MAALAAWLSGISMNPKPLARPVSRSVMIWILSTTPYGSKSWRRSSSVALYARCQQRYSRSIPSGKGDNQSPDHPPSMQEPKAEAIRRRSGEEDLQGHLSERVTSKDESS